MKQSMDSMRWRYCDCCLIGGPWNEFRLHFSSEFHKGNSILYRRAATRIFELGKIVLKANGDDWERCFSCGSTMTPTVVSRACSHCDGGGDRAAEHGVPGVPYRGGNQSSRFVCEECAKNPFCRSCASHHGPEDLYLDPDAVEALESAEGHPAVVSEDFSQKADF